MGLIADVRSGALTVLEAAKVANPTLFGELSRARPGSFGFSPTHVYVGEMRMDLAFNTSLRNWNGELDVVIVFSSWDNEQWQEDADTITTAIVDAFSDAPHFADPNSVAEPVRIRTRAEEDGGANTYPAVVVTIGRIQYKEGR